MDLMTLAAKIQLDDSNFRQGIKSAEGAGRALANKMSAMTVAVGQIAADMVKKAAAGAKSILEGSIGGYADYQQLVGGVETLFKNSAAKISKYAEQSYKTTGLSANKYMETVTSFSASLLQGLKGDTETAAEMANMAVEDMADNANKMGTDISSIQAAYQGFAKQNYTMLDNLKLGYGGTQSEMVRLINDSKILDHEISDLDDITFDQLVQAIHEIQTEMGITGTTAKEAAETISGSGASLKAAWEDMLVTVAGTGEDDTDEYHHPLQDAFDKFQESFATYAKNIIPTIANSIRNSGELALAVSNAITDLPEDLLSQVGEGLIHSGTQTVEGATEVTEWIIKNMTNGLHDAANNPKDTEEFGKAVGYFVSSTVKDMVKNAPQILDDIGTLGTTLAVGLVEGMFEGLFGKGAEVDKITEQLQDDLTDIDMENNQATAILKYMDKLYEKFGNGVTRTNEWKAAQEELEEVLPQAGKVFENYGSDIQGALDTLDKLNKSMRENAIVSGMQKALHDEYELLGEQEGTAAKAQTAITLAQEKRNTAQAGLVESLTAYAQEYLRQNLEYYGLDTETAMKRIGTMVERGYLEDYETPEGFMQMDPLIQSALSILQGGKAKVYNGTGFDEVNLEDLTDKQLKKLLDQIVPEYKNGEESIWEQSALDNIYDPETIKKFIQTITDLNAQIQEQTEVRDEAVKQAQLTQESIDLTEATLRRTMQERAEKSGQAIEESGTTLSDALNSVARKIASLSLAGQGIDYVQEDTGIDWVPTNGFKASLHRGEAVLTKAENEKRLNGAGSAEVVGAIQGLRQDMQNLRLMVGRKTFGRAVVDYGGEGVNDYIGGSNSRDAAGYGT